MAKEIERKFLVNYLPDPDTIEMDKAEVIQGYLSTSPNVVRIRIVDFEGYSSSYLTIKGHTTGISRLEYEYHILEEEAKELLSLCETKISKTRLTYYVDNSANLRWEVDIFHDQNEGLIVAEIELPSEDYLFVKPAWVGEEVSYDPRYYNSNLLSHPFCEWTK